MIHSNLYQQVMCKVSVTERLAERDFIEVTCQQ